LVPIPRAEHRGSNSEANALYGTTLGAALLVRDSPRDAATSMHSTATVNDSGGGGNNGRKLLKFNFFMLQADVLHMRFLEPRP